MKWHYDYDEDVQWKRKMLPRRHYCKYCYGRRNVYYLHDDFISAKKEFHVMMICSNCTYHLAPIVVSITEAEMQALSRTPLKTHDCGSVTSEGITQRIIKKLPVMPYGFSKGKPQYPSINILSSDLYNAIKDLGVVPIGIIEKLKEKETSEERLIGLYQKARQFREDIDSLVFPKR
jgi:hypothetical protein